MDSVDSADIRMPPARDCFEPLFETPETALLEAGGLRRSERLEGQAASAGLARARELSRRAPRLPESPEAAAASFRVNSCSKRSTSSSPSSRCQYVSVPRVRGGRSRETPACCATGRPTFRAVAGARAPELIDQAGFADTTCRGAGPSPGASPLALTASATGSPSARTERATAPHVQDVDRSTRVLIYRDFNRRISADQDRQRYSPSVASGIKNARRMRMPSQPPPNWDVRTARRDRACVARAPAAVLPTTRPMLGGRGHARRAVRSARTTGPWRRPCPPSV